MYYTHCDARILCLQREEVVQPMNFTRLRCWFLSAPITLVVVVYLLTFGNNTTSFHVIVGFIGFFVEAMGVFVGEKLYQKYKDKW
jgi:hypothetical protein